jgi:hypothetical protein
MSSLIRALAVLALLLAGCDARAPAGSRESGVGTPPAGDKRQATTTAAPESKIQNPKAKIEPPPQSAIRNPQSAIAPPRPARPSAPLEDLVRQAAAAEFNLPAIDEGKIAAAGIRKLTGKHITLYTDLPVGNAAVDELPGVFDLAVPQWCVYFGVDSAKIADWKVVGCVMKDKERFLGAGLYDENLPPFPHGFARGSQLWLYDQPSDYYRRHLLLHEGTHAFMNRWLGGAGPPWYMEGMAELLGTHRWEGGKLTLAYVPRSKEEVPYWGRVKVVKDEFAAHRAMPLLQIMAYNSQAHLRTEAYAWSWAAAALLDQHPRTQAAFRELKSRTGDRTNDFSKQFYDSVKEHWREIDEDWQVFVTECDYGYDFARAAIVRKAASELPAAGATVTIAADRGWQSTGFKLRAGQAYQLIASGRFQVAKDPKPWPCEAGGVTIGYHRGRPLGMLLAAVNDEETPPGALTPLVAPQPIGAAGTITPETSGTLYLRINESPAGLADNAGTLNVRIAEHSSP